MKGSIQIALTMGILFLLFLLLVYLVLYVYNPPVDRKMCCQKICEKEGLTYHEIKYVDGSQMCIGKDKSGSFRDFEMTDEICDKIFSVPENNTE